MADPNCLRRPTRGGERRGRGGQATRQEPSLVTCMRYPPWRLGPPASSYTSEVKHAECVPIARRYTYLHVPTYLPSLSPTTYPTALVTTRKSRPDSQLTRRGRILGSREATTVTVTTTVHDHRRERVGERGRTHPDVHHTMNARSGT